MPNASRWIAIMGALALLAPALAGCGDNEPEQRRAFIAFLQTRIIDKPGLHIPIMSNENAEKFGPYAQRYAIMSGFHRNVDASVSRDIGKAMEINQPRSVEELVSRRALLPVLANMTKNMAAELDRAKAAADAAHLALKQPDDLKAVYDKAYERMVTGPAATLRELTMMIGQGIPALEELAAYLDDHRTAIVYRGGMPVTNDPHVRAKIENLMRAAGEVADRSEEGKRKLRKLVEGN